MNEQALIAPRTFISYSWSSPSHEQWVLSLASRLREDGVDVVLDKWDLKAGHDSIKFMESMVTDKDVKKVLMICDKVYAEKANARAGGVGTESQIISPEIYKNSTQDKFAAAITENDEDGNAYVPAYYAGRIYFDFVSGDNFENSYEQLLRWLIDRPQYVKPKLGSIPESILSTNPAATATQSRAKRVEDALRNDSTRAAALIREYGDALIPELKSLTPSITPDIHVDDAVLDALAALRPYARQFSALMHTAARYSTDILVWDALASQMERFGELMHRQPDLMQWNQLQFDPFKIVSNEMLLSAVASLLDEERFDIAERLLSRRWLLRPNEGHDRKATVDFTGFCEHIQSLEIRNNRLKLNRISLQADLLRDEYQSGTPTFESIMQADFVIFLRSLQPDTDGRWFPFSLVYSERRFSPFSVFARSESKEYFAKLAPVLGASSVVVLQERIAEFHETERARQMFHYNGLAASRLANSKYLATRP